GAKWLPCQPCPRPATRRFSVSTRPLACLDDPGRGRYLCADVVSAWRARWGVCRRKAAPIPRQADRGTLAVRGQAGDVCAEGRTGSHAARSFHRARRNRTCALRGEAVRCRHRGLATLWARPPPGRVEFRRLLRICARALAGCAAIVRRRGFLANRSGGSLMLA